MRFVKMRSIAGKENAAHLVSCTPEHIAFGLGRYACPGRFFAAHEVKIAMCHILLKYDIKFAKPDEAALPFNYGITIFCSPTAEIAIRRRNPELDIDSIMA
jgi:cytochrome P450